MPSSKTRPVWRVVLGTASSRTRRTMGTGVVLGVLGRVALVGAASAVGRGDAAAAGAFGFAAAALFVFQRFALAAARVNAECDLYRAAACALLQSDVLEVPTEELQRVVFETNHHGRALLATTIPALAADVVVSFAMVPVLATILPPRVIGLALLGLVVVVVSLAAMRRMTRGLAERLIESTQRVFEGVLIAVDGRLELVARGGDATFARDFGAELQRYARVAIQSSIGSAVLGRVPILLGASAIGLVALFDATTRATLGTAVLSEALLLASILPVFVGVAMGVNEFIRVMPLLRPLVHLLGAPPRADHSTVAGAVPALPAPITFDNVSFSYAPDAIVALENIELVWPTDRPLIVTGANGGGKSTLLRLLLGLRLPTQGSIKIGCTDLAAIDLRALRQRIAYLPQRTYLGEAYVTVRTAMLHGRVDVTDEQMTRNLRRTGVLDALAARAGAPLQQRIGELSVGQRQRVALARVLLQDAPITLLDEPDANLDSAGVAMVAALVVELAADGKMVAVVAHTAELAAIPGVHVNVDRSSNERPSI